MYGKYYYELKNRPSVLGSAAVVGKTESEGPLAKYFDVMYPNDGIRSDSWEQAEASLSHEAVEIALAKSSVDYDRADILFGGDLLNQCTATTFGVKKFGIPYVGLFGACSTFALALCLGAMALDGGYASNCVAVSSSHFCGAEKQFRSPLEYGGQRTQSAQRTVTGAGACVISTQPGNIKIRKIMIGRVCDMNVNDPTNMGAAMAPAAYRTISDFLRQTNTRPGDYDMILTGDLGSVGSDLLHSLMREHDGTDVSSVHYDCGKMIFDPLEQDVHAGGSGCGCSAAVVCSYIFKQMRDNKLRNVLFVGTGALMSPLITMQKDSIPGIAHAVLLSTEG